MTDRPRRVVVVGAGPMLRACAATLAELGTDVITIPLEPGDGGAFQLAPLAEYPPGQWQAFAVAGSELLNLVRLGLMSGLRSAGYRLVGVVSPRASVPAGWVPPENGFVDDNAVVGQGVVMRHNVVVGAGAIIGAGARLGHSVWLGPAAILGHGVSVGDGTIIASGAIVADGVTVGRQCELGIARQYLDDVPERSYFSPSFDEVVRIHSSSAGARPPQRS